MLRFVLLVSCLTVAACGTPESFAFRDGTGRGRTEADMRQDEAQCRYEIAMMAQGRFVPGPAYLPLCMEAKGWRRA